MAQRLSASANGPAPPEPAAAPAEGPRDARARAAAFLDLWERQLALAAARGWEAAPPGERPSGG